MEKAKQDPEFFEKQLYWTPDHPPYDFFIRYHNWQLGLLVEFFKEVFEEKAFLHGYQPSNKYYRVILPKTKHDEIINCINDFELLPIRDLLFEVIAIAQDNYVEHIAFWERPEMQKLVTSAEKETQKAIQIIEKLDEKPGCVVTQEQSHHPSCCISILHSMMALLRLSTIGWPKSSSTISNGTIMTCSIRIGGLI